MALREFSGELDPVPQELKPFTGTLDAAPKNLKPFSGQLDAGIDNFLGAEPPKTSALKENSQDAAAALLKIFPTAAKGVADIAQLVTGGKYGGEFSGLMQKGMDTIDKGIGSQKLNDQKAAFNAVMNDPNKGLKDLAIAAIDNPRSSIDAGVTTLGSMILPAGVAKGAIALAPAAAKMAAATGATIGTNAIQNAADTFTSIDSPELSDKYKGAGISGLASLLIAPLTGGGAEGAIARKMAGEKSVNGAVAVIGKILGVTAKEAGQETGEEIGNYIGESVGNKTEINANQLLKRGAYGGALGAMLGGGTGAMTQIGGKQLPEVIQDGSNVTVGPAPTEFDNAQPIPVDPMQGSVSAPAQPAVNPIAALSELIAGTATQNSPLEPVSAPTADQFLGEPTDAPASTQDDFLDTPTPQQEPSTANKLDNAFMWRNGNVDVPIQVVAEKLGTNAAGQREILALVDGQEQSIPIDEIVRRGDAQALEIPQIPGNEPINNLESQDVIDISQEQPNEATTMQKAEAAIPGSPIDPINPSTMQKAQSAIPEQINAPAFIDLDKHAQLQAPKPGMRIGDITHKNGSVFKTKQAAKDVAKKAGKGWVTAPSNQGFVVRFRPQTDKQVAATAKRIAKQREVRQSDSMLQAISKLGGINSDELVKDWGVSLADLGNKGSGVFRVATKGGMSADRMADSLKELGFISSDPITGKHDLAEMMDLFQEEARGGAKTYAHSDDGGKVAEQYSQYQNDGYDEWIAAKDAEEAGLNKLSAEAQAFIGELVGEQYDRTQEEYAKLDQELAQWEQSGESQDRIPEFNDQAIDANGGRVAQEAGEFDSNPAGEDRGDQGATQANEGAGQKQSPVRQTGTGSQRSSQESFSLESQTEATLKAAEEAKAAAEKAKQEADRAAEARAKADAEVGQFNLTGSDRAADVAAAQGQQELGASDAIFSSNGKGLPESKWLSEAAISQIIENRIADFAYQAPIFIRDRASEIVTLPAGTNDSDISGLSFNGNIYLFRAGLSNRASVTQTLWHELLHHGIRRFMTKNEYIAATKKLYNLDAWVKSRADSWVSSNEGQEVVKLEGLDYAISRGVDEALADLAETNQGVFTKNSLKAKAIRTISRWIAFLANKLGFKDSAKIWRAISNDEARALIQTIFGKLKTNAAPIDGNSGFTSDPTFRIQDMEEDLQDDIDLGVPKQKFEKVSTKDFFSISKNEFGQHQYTAGMKLYKNLSTLASEHLGALKLADNKPEAFKQMMRQFKVDQLKAGENAKRIAEAGMELSPEQRETLSELVEKNAKPGDLPPTEIEYLATKITAALDIQAKQLIDLGMISEERLVKNYLPRIYKHGLAAKLTNPTLLAGWFTKARMKIRGERLKTRGMFAEMPSANVAMAKKLGWIPSSMTDGAEIPQDLFDAFDKSQPIPPNYQDTKVLMWRDYTEAERAEMGEIRDGVFRYAMGYVETQKDVAIGRLFKAIAGNTELAKTHNPGGWKQVPNVEIKGAPGVKQYGALSGMYVNPQVLDALTRNTQPKGILMAAYDKALNFWKEGKTVWNPVSHGNNVVSNLFTVYFAGVNPASPSHWRETLREFRTKGEYWNEAVDNGLFGHEFANQEIQQMLMPDFNQMEDLESVAASRVAKVIEFSKKYPGKPLSWYRENMQKAYEFEDQFFKLMLYIDRRKSGMDPQAAITDAERYVFNYSDMPEGIELLKRTYSPFFAYTYKAIPMVLHTAMTRPDRLLAPIALLGGANWLAYMVMGGDEEKDRKGMPEYMQGRTAIGTQKSIRMPFDIEGNPAFMDLSRRVPLGDLFDINNQTNGLPLPAPFMPSHPVLSIMQAVIYNQDTFTGKDLVKKSDTKWEAAQARGAYLYRQFAPNAPMIPGSYNFNKLMDATANTFDTEIGSYTGKTKSGDSIKLAPTALDVFTGTKIRSFDPERGIDYQAAALQKEAKEIGANISSANRNQAMTPDSKGRYIASQQDKLLELRKKNEELRK